MRYKINTVNAVFLIASLIATIVLLWVYDGTEEYKLLCLMPFSFFVMSLISGKMISRTVPGNFGVTVFLMLLFIRTVLFPVFFALGGYTHVFRVYLISYMPKAIMLSVYEVIMIFIVFLLCDWGADKKEKKMMMRERVTTYNLYIMRFIVFGLLLVFLLTFAIVPECQYFYQSISNITEAEFTNNEMSTVIDQYGTDFTSKLILVLHNYLTKIIRFVLPLHLVFEIHKKNKRASGYWMGMIISAVNIFIIDGTIARGLVYAFALMLLTCEIYNRQKNIYKIAIVAIGAIVAYFAIRAIYAVGMKQNIWEYLSSYIGSYFSSVANTAANIRMNLTGEEKAQFLAYDILESIPFGNTLFGLESISYQKVFNDVNRSAGQIPTTIGAGYTYFGTVFAPIISMIFAKIAFSAGQVVKHSKSVFKKGVYLLLAIYSAMAITMYYHKIVLVVVIGALIPMILVNKLVEGRRKQSHHADSKES